MICFELSSDLYQPLMQRLRDLQSRLHTRAQLRNVFVLPKRYLQPDLERRQRLAYGMKNVN
jgi:hypothetical protein